MNIILASVHVQGEGDEHVPSPGIPPYAENIKQKRTSDIKCVCLMAADRLSFGALIVDFQTEEEFSFSVVVCCFFIMTDPPPSMTIIKMMNC